MKRQAILTAPQEDLLRHLATEADRFGYGARPRKSPDRDKLQRLGLIHSVRRGPSTRGIAGHGLHWHPTEAGTVWIAERDGRL